MTTQNQHKPNDFTPVVGAMELAEYVFHITENPGKFKDYALKEQKSESGGVTQVFFVRDDSLTNLVRAEAREIFHLTYSANEINLTKQPWRKKERLGKQARAIELCGDIIDPKNVKHERKKLRKMSALVKTGKMTQGKFDECYCSWKAHANLGNSYLLLRRMDGYVKTLFTEVEANEGCSEGNCGVEETPGADAERHGEAGRDHGL